MSQIDESRENVLAQWPGEPQAGTTEPDTTEPGTTEPDAAEPDATEPDEEEGSAWGTAAGAAVADDADVAAELAQAEPAQAEVVQAEPDAPEPELPQPGGTEAIAVEPSHEHAAGDLKIPDGYAVLEGDSDGSRRAVGVVVARFNGGVTSRLLERALEELENAGVRREAITVMVVPGAFELPLAATALAKTRRFACIVALGCVIRGETSHFEYVASEAASGLQLAALETGVPVSFGVLTLDDVAQADARIEKGAEAVRTALEMADVFAHLRAAASASR